MGFCACVELRFNVFETAPCRFHDAICGEEEVSGPLPRLLLANKSDLVMQRQVSPDAVKAAAQRFDCKYLETSARLGTGVELAFQMLIRYGCVN